MLSFCAAEGYALPAREDMTSAGWVHVTDLSHPEKDKMPFVPVYGETEGRGKVGVRRRTNVDANMLKIPDSCLSPCANNAAAATA